MRRGVVKKTKRYASFFCKDISCYTLKNMEQTITITQRVMVPRELVFAAWTDPAQVVRWFYASAGWSTPFAEMNVVPQGEFRIGFQSPDGKHDFVFAGTYQEIVRPEYMVLVLDDGRSVTVHFDEANGETMVTLVVTLEQKNSVDQQREGWSAILRHLAEYLALS
jgi:uncharacterized protein YndB with AHSA1/START domain